MSDEFIAILKNDWKAQEPEFESVKRRLRRARWTTRAIIIIEAVLLLIGIAAGAWFAITAWRHSDVFFGISAVTLIFVALPSAVVLFRLRIRLLAESGKSPEDMLNHALSRARETDRILAIGEWNAIALLVFVGVLWAGVWVGWISHRYPVILLSGIWIVSAVTALAWCAWRRRRNDREREQCLRLLAQYDGARAAER